VGDAFGEAAAFLLETGMGDKDISATGELTIELAAAASKPSGAYVLPTNSLVGSGGIKVTITSGVGQDKVTHFTGYSAKT